MKAGMLGALLVAGQLAGESMGGISRRYTSPRSPYERNCKCSRPGERQPTFKPEPLKCEACHGKGDCEYCKGCGVMTSKQRRNYRAHKGGES